jgi:hydroxymethylpyrimidine/phosphomethylpyrimidine kinase
VNPEIAIIAGFDSSGGAGLVVDGETVRALGGRPRFATTALTAQTNDLGLAVEPSTASILEAQLRATFAHDLPRAIKIGMLPNRQSATMVASQLQALAPCPVVFDPVLQTSSGLPLMDDDCFEWIRAEFFSSVSLVTPNLFEASRFTGRKCEDRSDMVRVAEELLTLGAGAVLVKGGHLAEDFAPDCLLQRGMEPDWFETPRLTGFFRGTGCRLSSAIATRLAFGDDLHDAVGTAKAYLTDCLHQWAG